MLGAVSERLRDSRRDYAWRRFFKLTPFSSVWIGLIGGIVCFWGVFSLKKKFGYDDARGCPFGLHGLGGTWGGIATGLFATTSVNADGANGLFYGDISLLFGKGRLRLLQHICLSQSSHTLLLR